jgi:hypothetical protein
MDTILCHPREVFRLAIMASAAAIFIARNHPSGEATPSEADIKITRDLIRTGQLLKIEVLGHIVIGNPNHSSLRSLGYFSEPIAAFFKGKVDCLSSWGDAVAASLMKTAFSAGMNLHKLRRLTARSSRVLQPHESQPPDRRFPQNNLDIVRNGQTYRLHNVASDATIRERLKSQNTLKKAVRSARRWLSSKRAWLWGESPFRWRN